MKTTENTREEGKVYNVKITVQNRDKKRSIMMRMKGNISPWDIIEPLYLDFDPADYHLPYKASENWWMEIISMSADDECREDIDESIYMFDAKIFLPEIRVREIEVVSINEKEKSFRTD